MKSTAAYLIANDDVRLAMNQCCWLKPTKMEIAPTRARKAATLAVKAMDAHFYGYLKSV